MNFFLGSSYEVSEITFHIFFSANRKKNAIARTYDFDFDRNSFNFYIPNCTNSNDVTLKIKTQQWRLTREEISYFSKLDLEYLYVGEYCHLYDTLWVVH